MIEMIPNWHPAWVHFPIAFTTAALVFTALGILFKHKPFAAQCLTTGSYMLWAAALFALIAAVFGWFAFNSVTHNEISHAAMILHRNWALGALIALLALAFLDWRRRRTGSKTSFGFLFGLAAAWLLVTSTAWHGTELVYRHGLGVMQTPDMPVEPNMDAHDAPHHQHTHTH